MISLGLESGAALLILDDQPARRLATSLGLRVIGTVGLLMAGKERGFLAKIRPELDRLPRNLASGLGRQIPSHKPTYGYLTRPTYSNASLSSRWAQNRPHAA